MECNASASRLDLSDELILKAKEYGVKFSINTDAHSVLDLPRIELGIATARRGWLEKKDVVNTYSLEALQKELGKKRKR